MDFCFRAPGIMATDAATNLAQGLEDNEPISLKTVDDHKLRFDKLCKIFNDPLAETQNAVQLKIFMSRLEK